MYNPHDAGRRTPPRLPNRERPPDRWGRHSPGGRVVCLPRTRSEPLSQIRAFFAVDLTNEVRAHLEQAISSARSLLSGEPIRWVRAETLHLTLRFLGETSRGLLDGVQQAAAAQAGSWRAFRMEVRGLGCFPNGQRPRVIWAAAQDPSGSLEVLATDLERLARETGFPAEERRFSAHLTIGRVKDRLSPEGQRRLAEWIQMSSDESYGTVQVGSIELFKSDLRPAGPIYSSLATFPLRG